MSNSVFEKFIGIARPGDVVILTIKRSSSSFIEETKRGIEAMQAKAPGVSFMLVDADGFEVQVKEAPQVPQGVRQ